MKQLDINCLIALIAGIATAIPLCIKLVQYVRQAVHERNWQALIRMIISLMEQAEVNLSNGATRKNWVMNMVETEAKWVGYEVDMDLISQMIDELCEMSKVVNADAETEKA